MSTLINFEKLVTATDEERLSWLSHKNDFLGSLPISHHWSDEGSRELAALITLPKKIIESNFARLSKETTIAWVKTVNDYMDARPQSASDIHILATDACWSITKHQNYYVRGVSSEYVGTYTVAILAREAMPDSFKKAAENTFTRSMPDILVLPPAPHLYEEYYPTDKLIQSKLKQLETGMLYEKIDAMQDILDIVLIEPKNKMVGTYFDVLIGIVQNDSVKQEIHLSAVHALDDLLSVRSDLVYRPCAVNFLIHFVDKKYSMTPDRALLRALMLNRKENQRPFAPVLRACQQKQESVKGQRQPITLQR